MNKAQKLILACGVPITILSGPVILTVVALANHWNTGGSLWALLAVFAIISSPFALITGFEYWLFGKG